MQHIQRRSNELKELQQICVGLETPWNSMHIAIMPREAAKAAE